MAKPTITLCSCTGPGTSDRQFRARKLPVCQLSWPVCDGRGAQLASALGQPHAKGWQVSRRTRPARPGMTDTGVLGAWLRSCREFAGLSQEELAEQAGLSVRAVGNGRARGPHAIA
jgi:hypothetical protein